MIETPSVDWFALSPTLALLGAAGVALMVAVLLPPWMRKGVSAATAFVGFVLAAGLAGYVFDQSPTAEALIGESMTRDRLAALTQVILGVTGAVVVLVSWAERRRAGHGEYYALLATAGAGMVFFVGAGNLMTLFLGLEWFSLCLYVLVAFDTDRAASLEASLKYLIVGGFGSAVLLFGSALVYGATGELSFTAIAQAVGSQGLDGDFMLLIGFAMVLAGFAIGIAGHLSSSRWLVALGVALIFLGAFLFPLAVNLTESTPPEVENPR